jgi:hypothetical protein
VSAFIGVEKTMTLNARIHRAPLQIIIFLALLTSLFFNPAPAIALGDGESALPDFGEFLKRVQNNEASVLRGVYVPDVLAFPVVQQPAEEAGYVSHADGEITQFNMAARFENVGLLAHNHLSGRFFPQLALGQEVRLVYGNGKVEYFVITQIMQYQAFQPTSQQSTFRDLRTDEQLTAEQLFKKVYTGDRHVTFQTCIAGPGSASWGRLFVIAIPNTPFSSMEYVLHRVGR